MGFWTILKRSLLLHCPLCGRGTLFRGLFTMHEECPSCGIRFEREPGFFLGSIYINYGITSLIIAIGYPVLRFRYGLPETPLLVGALLVVLLLPLLLFRHARSLWLGFDQWRDPQQVEPADSSRTP